MNKSIMSELKAHVLELIKEGAITEDNVDNAHHIAFNEDYYIIGYWSAEKWLEMHEVSVWDAISYVVEQDTLAFGECTLIPAEFNAEKIVNLLAYYAGMEIDFEDILKTEKGE